MVLHGLIEGGYVVASSILIGCQCIYVHYGAVAYLGQA